MDPRCTAIHPAHPPLPLHPPSPSPCVQCALSTVTNPKAVYTLRRSACTTLTSLSNDPANLLRLGVSFLSDILHGLLNALLPLSSSESELAEDLTSVCVSLACHSYKYANVVSARRLSVVLFSECTAAVMLQDSTVNASRSISLLARLCEECESQQISLPFESLPDDFAHNMLSRCDGSTAAYSSLNLLLGYVLKGIHPNRSKELLQAAVSSLPTRRDPDADRMFLTVVSYLTETDPDVLLECDTFPVVLKTAFMTSIKDLRETAALIILKISVEPSHAKKLGETALFEYIVESLRISDPYSVQVPLLQYSATALSALARKQASEKWIYSLDVVLSVGPILGSNIDALEPAVCTALQEAPSALFSSPLIEAVVSFCMQMLAHEKDVTQLVTSISSLLERLRPDVRCLHAILSVVEAITHSKDHIGCVALLTTNIGIHFVKLTRQTDNGTAVDDLVRLGRRLSFVTFDAWALRHKETIETMNTFAAATSSYSIDVLACTMDMFTTMLDKGFMIVGAYNLDDRRRMVSWCWQMLPPRLAFVYCLKADRDKRIISSAAKYCQAISSEEAFDVQLRETPISVTEEMFLADLATDPAKSTSLVALQLLRRALDIKMLESVCEPELVVQALKERLNLILSHSLVTDDAECASVLRLLARVCAYYELRFPKLEISEAVLVMTLTNSGFSFSNETDCLIFLFIIREGNRSAADVAAWEMFADYCKVAISPQTASSDMMERILQDESCLESAMYAIPQAKDPIAIAECLLCIVDKTKPNNTLGRTLEKIGVLYTSCQSLRDVESNFNRGDETRYQTQCRRLQYAQDMKTGIGFLVLFSGANCMSDSGSWRTLTRAVCDVFVIVASKKSRMDLTDMLLTAALNYLVALTPFLKPGSASSIRYIWQGGVVDSALRILVNVSGDSRRSDHLIAATCSFLVAVLHIADKCALEFRRKAVAVCLQGVRWDRMLSSFPLAADIDGALRIVKCCGLLKDILSGDSGDTLKLNKATSYRTTVALAVASCSIFVVVRDAAFDLLRTLLQIDTTITVWQRYLNVHHEISHALLQKLHENAICILTKAEFNYLQEAVRHGHLDKCLITDCSTLPSKTHATCPQRKPDQERSNSGFHEKIIQILEERKAALSKDSNCL